MDQRGRLIAFIITAGQRGDAPVASELIALAPAAEILAADRAYDSDALRRELLARGTRPVIPNAPYRKHLHPFDAEAYKRRNLVERAFCRLKDALPHEMFVHDGMAMTLNGDVWFDARGAAVIRP